MHIKGAASTLFCIIYLLVHLLDLAVARQYIVKDSYSTSNEKHGSAKPSVLHSVVCACAIVTYNRKGSGSSIQKVS